MRNCFGIFFVFCLILFQSSCSDLREMRQLANRQVASDPNLPYLVVISIDSFRAEYLKSHSLKTISAIKERGFSTDRFTPSFPSDLYPGYYSAATGLHPDQSGIVANTFYDPRTGQEFEKGRRGQNGPENGKWYYGTPFWVALERAGIRTAGIFWPGSSAEIGGTRPTFFHHFEDQVSTSNELEEVKTLLSLEADKRPHVIFLALYAIDEAGHKFGPKSKEVDIALKALDEQLGKFVTSIDKLGIPVNLFLLSLNGMDDLKEREEYIGDYIDLNTVKVLGNGTRYLIYGDNPSAINKAYDQLRTQGKHFRVYKRSELPERYHCSQEPRCGEIILMATIPYRIRLKRGEHLEREKHNQYRGSHGWEISEAPLMAGVFYASGPQIKAGSRIPEMSILQLKHIILRLFNLRDASDSKIEEDQLDKIFK